jgi:hypothetical protein
MRELEAMSTIPERVDRGFSALTEYWGGTFWVDRIDVWTLNVESVNACPLFMVFGGYTEGLDVLGLDSDLGAKSHGFELEDYAYAAGENEALTDEWVRRINEVPAGS